jgi:drug/metabolite transporter (DMT)-like permease
MNFQRWVAIILVLVGASSYGVLSSFIKMAYGQGYGDGQITPAQITTGALMVWILIAFDRKSWVNPFRGPWIKLSMVGIFGLALTTVFINISLAGLDASLSIVLLFQFTWITIALDCIVHRRWPRQQEIMAIILIMIGTFLAVNIFGTEWSDVSGSGLLFGLLSAVTYSLFLFLTGLVKTNLPPLMNSAIMLTAALPMIYILYPPLVLVQGDSLNLWLWGLWLGLIGSVIPTVCFNIGIPKVGSSLSAMLGSLELPVAVIAAFLLLGEPVAWVQWLGMIFILGGIVISEKKTKRQQSG